MTAVRSAHGSTLLEVAFSLSLLFTLLGGVVDLWSYCRDAEVILTASRHGARAAAAKAQRVSESDPTAACNYAATSGAGGERSEVLETALRLANRYLVAAGLEGSTCSLGVREQGNARTCDGPLFLLTARFDEQVEDDLRQKTVRLSIEPKSARSCLLCTAVAQRRLTLNATSTFALETDCNAAA